MDESCCAIVNESHFDIGLHAVFHSCIFTPRLTNIRHFWEWERSIDSITEDWSSPWVPSFYWMMQLWLIAPLLTRFLFQRFGPNEALLSAMTSQLSISWGKIRLQWKSMPARILKDYVLNVRWYLRHGSSHNQAIKRRARTTTLWTWKNVGVLFVNCYCVSCIGIMRRLFRPCNSPQIALQTATL